MARERPFSTEPSRNRDVRKRWGQTRPIEARIRGTQNRYSPRKKSAKLRRIYLLLSGVVGLSEGHQRFIDIGVQPSLGMIAIGLVGLIVLGVVFSLVFWPRSRRWKRSSQLHTLAVRNQKEIRREIESQIDASIRILTRARKDYGVSGTPEIDDLIRQVRLMRDRVAAGYVASPANAPSRGGDLDLQQFDASNVLLRACQDLEVKGKVGAPQALNAPQIERLKEDLDTLGHLLP